jgi:hypothetical protein
MTDVINLSGRRQPVTYTVTITHHWDGTIETFVHDVSDDERSRASVGDVLVRVAETYLNKRLHGAGDDMLAIMLANIDHSMSCTEETPAILRVTPSELAAWADAVAKYEAVRFPINEVKDYD